MNQSDEQFAAKVENEYKALIANQSSIIVQCSHYITRNCSGDLCAVQWPDQAARKTHAQMNVKDLREKYHSRLLSLLSRYSVADFDGSEEIIDRITDLCQNLIRDHHDIGKKNFCFRSKSRKISIFINEPPFTEAGLGWETWGGSIVMCKLITDEIMPPSIFANNNHILELGSGTGLVASLISNMYSNCYYVATDYLESILDNLTANIYDNRASDDLRMYVCHLDWFKCKDDGSIKPQLFDTLIATDVIYDSDHARVIPKVVSRFLKKGGTFYCVLPLRPAFQRDVTLFEQEMNAIGFYTRGTIAIWNWESDSNHDVDFEQAQTDEMCRDGVWYRYYIFKN